MNYTILDCYTDEPAGLGVPPYIGTYPRYIYGRIKRKGNNVKYLRIDDLRLYFFYDNKIKKKKKTDKKIYNRTNQDVNKILNNTDVLIVISGIHVPGKYLSALPGTLFEVVKLVKNINCKKILTGPAATEFGSRLEGGKSFENINLSVFDEIIPDYVHDYKKIAKYAIFGAEIVKYIPDLVVAEIETSRGCSKKVPCSFCTEPLKNKLEFRNINDITDEVKELNKAGVVHFRLGKQSDFFMWSCSEIEKMLSSIRKECDIETLHIDNIDPAKVTEEKVKLVTKYCTEGNVAALGIESFDSEIVKKNHLNSTPDTSMKAIKIINKHGKKYGKNGMPLFLPGINLLFGLYGETKKTHEKNMKYLKQILKEELLIRRINIRQVSVYKNTDLDKLCGIKYLCKNKKYYWKWRHQIRQDIDNEILKRLVPVGHILKNVRTEVHDGNNTFARQAGTYPLVVGIKEKLPLKKNYDVKIIDHMLRSVTGEVLRLPATEL
ncbi:radical SAM protein [Candidatus Woesearchaeota archaeon]|nr:radical SAM protein [Candidatus Woesearchaeota archaeon]